MKKYGPFKFPRYAILGILLLGCSQDNNPEGVSIALTADVLNYPLPAVYIDTNDTSIDSKENYIDGRVRVEGRGGFPDLETSDMRIRGRGNSTWWLGQTWGKKPYQIKFENKTTLLGMPEDRRWVLLPELSDKTLIRNMIARDWGQLSRLEYTPQLRFAEVFLNDDPQGVYVLGQKVEETNNRVAIGDEGYLIEIDQLSRIDDEDVYFQTNAFRAVSSESVFNVKEPEIAPNSSELALIREHILAFEEVLFSDGFAHRDTGYAAYIDVDSFIDWYLINEIAKSVDAMFYSSIFFSYLPGEKIKMGPIWDFDLSYGNVDYSNAQFAEGFWIRYNPWIQRLFEDPVFREKMKTRFAYFREQLPDILEKIDGYAAYLNEAQERNYSIWETLGVYVWPNPVIYESYPEEVNHLKDWMTRRIEWLDEELPGRIIFED